MAKREGDVEDAKRGRENLPKFTRARRRSDTLGVLRHEEGESMKRAVHELAVKVRRAVNKLGLDVVPFRHTRHPIARRQALFSHHAIDLVLDVGGNVGQYGRFLRNVGYEGRILSFEPLSEAFKTLQRIASEDTNWDVARTAMGTRVGTAILNVSLNSESSSILPMLSSHLEVCPDSRYVGSEVVPLTTLEEVLRTVADDQHIFLKVDTQGYERTVIEGAGDALSRIRGAQLEMSLVPLYEGEALLPEIVSFMSTRGFTLMGLEPGFSDAQTGQLLQVDGLFFRR
jgi:FkbM family methyltransferase